MIDVLPSIEAVGADDWNRLAADANPFLRHEFLSALESSGSACAETGWEPRHLLLRQGGEAVACMPLYLKHHSWGEFVFDHAWAEAFHRAGRAYYPKAVSCVPFTPVAGPRLLTAGSVDRRAAAGQLIAGAAELARREKASSLHVLFPADREVTTLIDGALMLRKDCQYHWHNRGYESFDDFVAGFRSARRKKLRRERRRVSEAGIRFRVIDGSQMEDDLLATVFRMHAVTFLRRGQSPYLNHDCFRMIRDAMGERMITVMAERGGKAVACAISIRDDKTLYGRYWGCVEYHDSLHFETCFYQGIEYCIRRGIERFEPGAQGEHKLRRGFDPTVTWSAHWVAEPAFAAAIEEYLDREREWVDRYVIDARDQLPFHRGADDRRSDDS